MRGLLQAGCAMCLVGTLGCESPGAQPTGDAPAAAATAAPEAVPAPAPKGPRVYTRELLSPVYEVDRIYKSMTGPNSTEDFKLGDPAKPELIWIVGFEAKMVAKDGKGPQAQEFMCHSNLDLDPTPHNETFGAKEKSISGRLFTLSQGQQRIDLPKGYGIPVVSDEALSLNTQVLNLNQKEGRREVRHRVVMRYVRDAELAEPYKALYVGAAYGLKLLEGRDGQYGVDAKAEQAGHGEHGAEHAACLPGKNAGHNEFDDRQGRKFTGHWVVEPGREENRTRVTDIMDLPFDTTLHYVAVHLHPFAESLELIDRTTGKSVYRAHTRQLEGGIGLAHVDAFSSEAGIPLYKDHEYEIVSVYENTSGEPQDSMAVMNLYLLDKEFRKPDLSKPPG